MKINKIVSSRSCLTIDFDELLAMIEKEVGESIPSEASMFVRRESSMFEIRASGGSQVVTFTLGWDE